MKKRHLAALLAGLAMTGLAASPAFAQAYNRLVGTWKMVSAVLDPQGANQPVYGPNPHGWLVFTPELTYIQVLTDPRVPKFANNARGQGTDAENRLAMASSIGMFGRYTVDERGEFAGNRVEGATFPNWVGNTRTRNDLRLLVEGDRMTEYFKRPEGAEVRIVWERVK